jgi:hypothetical protein
LTNTLGYYDTELFVTVKSTKVHHGTGLWHFFCCGNIKLKQSKLSFKHPIRDGGFFERKKIKKKNFLEKHVGDTVPNFKRSKPYSFLKV